MTAQDRLQAWLDEQHMKRTDLAKRMGISDALVSLVLSGDRQPSGEFKWRFSECFGNDTAKAVFNGDCQEAAA